MSSPLRNRLVFGAGSPLRNRSLATAAVASSQPLSPSRAFSTSTPLLQATPIPPFVVEQWDITKNKLRSPDSIDSSSTRLIHWQCRSCGAEFKKRVRDHCHDQGQCPSCNVTPTVLKKTAPNRPTNEPMSTPQFVKSQGRVLDPMLAQRWDLHHDRVSPNEDLFLSPKMDGVRCVVAYDATTKRPYFMSRLGNAFQSCDFIIPEIMKAFEKDPTLVLDAEIYSHDYANDFRSIISAVKVMRENRGPEHLAIQKNLQLHCFDVLYGGGITGGTPFALRLGYLERVLGRLAGKKTVLVEHDLVHKADVNTIHDKFVQQGYEGIMLRTGSGKYEFGKRSFSLLKMKCMQDDEFLVTGIVEGKGKLVGSGGAIECVTKNNEAFRANLAVPEDEREHYFRHPELLIGKMATIRFQELTPNGVPRFGVFKAVRSGRSKKDFV